MRYISGEFRNLIDGWKNSYNDVNYLLRLSLNDLVTIMKICYSEIYDTVKKIEQHKKEISNYKCHLSIAFKSSFNKFCVKFDCFKTNFLKPFENWYHNEDIDRNLGWTRGRFYGVPCWEKSRRKELVIRIISKMKPVYSKIQEIAPQMDNIWESFSYKKTRDEDSDLFPLMEGNCCLLI